MREFLDTTLLYADSIAIAVGSPPPPPPPPVATAAPGTPGQQPGSHHEDPNPPLQQGQGLSLLQLISRAAKEAEERSPQGVGWKEGSAAVDGREEGTEERLAGAGGGAPGAAVSVFEVSPWGKFTPALNALLGFAARDGAELVMFQVSACSPLGRVLEA